MFKMNRFANFLQTQRYVTNDIDSIIDTVEY